ncbi:MAG: DNA ligase [Labilithrix sp.]|nr:DNA ligase [Labilithrix sp.]MCW5811824.1 DNA ligase [Labilithrix sp.]
MPRDAKKLQRYRAMRSPEVTNEPFGYDTAETFPEKRAHGAYVVHLHDATRRHYDVRLEIGGELLSFAVPHGPSLDPSKKHLAVNTEVHPIEYLEFEDVIPKGEYGGGAMIAWDRGAVTYLEGPPEEEMATGKLHVELHGMKLRGRWAFVKLAKSAKGNEWLLFKKDDESANPGRDLLAELPRSVLSGLTVEELLERDAIGDRFLARAKALGATKLTTSFVTSRRPALAAIAGAKKPGSKAPLPPSLFDAELGGIRVLAARDGDVVTLRRWAGAAGEDVEAYYPETVRALRALPLSSVVLEGELIAFDPSGHPSRALLARRARSFASEGALRATTETPVILVVTDVLAAGDLDTRPLPIEDRRALALLLLPSIGFLRAASPLEGDEATLLEAMASLGIASAIAKPKGAPYDDGGWQRLETGVAPPSLTPIRHESTREVNVTNREKVYWPGDPTYTKGDLVDYYAAVADVLVPFLKSRPVILTRYPDGIEGKSFFQWNVPAGMPPWIRTLVLDRHEHLKRVFLVDDAATLLYVANLGCIPLHVLAARASSREEADFATIDFDVKQSTLTDAITLARTLHRILDQIGLPGFPKTSGQSGLHVLIPLGPGQSFDTARALAELLGRLLVERHPDIATMERVVGKRGDKVYVDTVQTGTSRAIVAPYSVRAVPGATVSAPLAWSEVNAKLDPRAFTIATMPKRLAKHGDRLAGLLEARPDVPAAVAALSSLVVARLTP